MKKSILIGLAAAMTLMSCSRDEVIVQNPDNAISFEGAYADNMTKANDITFDNIADLALYGSMKNTGGEIFTIFNGKKANVSQGKATYTPLQFWFEGNTYDFLAIAPYDHKMTDTGILDQTGLPDQMGMLNGSYYDTDLMIANPEPMVGKKNGNAAVGLNFKHILSRAKFSFSNEIGTNAYAIRIKDVKITSLPNAPYFKVNDVDKDGNVQWNNGKSDLSLSTAEFTVAADNTIENQQILASDHLFLVPFSDNYEADGTLKASRNTAKLEFSVDLMMMKNGQWAGFQTYRHSIQMPETFYQLKQGFSYNFKITLNMNNIDPDGQLEPIEFTVETVEGWNANAEQDQIIK